MIPSCHATSTMRSPGKSLPGTPLRLGVELEMVEVMVEELVESSNKED